MAHQVDPYQLVRIEWIRGEPHIVRWREEPLEVSLRDLKTMFSFIAEELKGGFR